MSVNSEIARNVVQKNFCKLQEVDQDWLHSHLYSIGLVDNKTRYATNLLSTICDGIKGNSSKFTELIEIFRTDINSYISDSLQSDYGEYKIFQDN